MTGNFFDRWSRRKREAEESDKALPSNTAVQGVPDTAAIADGETEPALPASRHSQESIQELIASLPDVTALTHESDVSVFMQGWVPEDMRRDALRKLWTVDKSVLEHVPLADYALDYNTPGAAPGYGTITTTADMVAAVAKMMGKAAFPEPEAPADMPSAERDSDADRADTESAAVLAGAPIKNSCADGSLPHEDAVELPVVTEPRAVREVSVEEVTFVGLHRRHGSAAPR
ncbi:MAG: DUF3306 domain-containing protein [Beijerinckiaceae bacterium]